MKKNIGNSIRLARVTRGLSQQNMADELGLTVASYSNIKRGITDITVTRLIEISKLLNVSVYQLLEEDKEFPSSVSDRSQNYTTLPLSLNSLHLKIERHDTEIDWIKTQIESLIYKIETLRTN
jgi:transcriptional regulator with XRE-family HTH domain